jgi:hypothetical protein
MHPLSRISLRCVTGIFARVAASVAGTTGCEHERAAQELDRAQPLAQHDEREQAR